MVLPVVIPIVNRRSLKASLAVEAPAQSTRLDFSSIGKRMLVGGLQRFLIHHELRSSQAALRRRGGIRSAVTRRAIFDRGA